MKRLYFTIVLMFSVYLLNAQTLLDTAENFVGKDTYGNVYELFDYLDEDKHVIIDFFTVACSYCQLYAPHVQRVYEDFGCNEGDVMVFGVNYGSDNDAVNEFDEVYGLNFPTISGTEGGGNKIASLYQIQSYPSVILIAPDRSIISQGIWPPADSNISEALIKAGCTPQPCYTGMPETLVPLNNYQIYPSPAKNEVFVEAVEINPDDITVSIFGPDAKLYFESVLSVSEKNNGIDIRSLPPGINVLQITDAKGNKEYHKLIRIP